MFSRKQIRKKILLKREQLDPVFCKNASVKICDKISRLEIFQKSNTIAFYLSIKNEVDPTPLLQNALQQSKKCYLPIIDQKENHLIFVKYNNGDELITNKFGILEPVFSNDNIQNIVLANELDLVIAPLVAFDNSNNRLGMGCGFYDRTFAFKQNAPKNTKPFLLGIGYEIQRIENIKPNKFDIKMDLIITEE